MSGKRRERSAWAEAVDIGSVGIEMAIAVAIGYLGGSWLDGRFDAAPTFMIAGTVVGILAAGRAIWRVGRRYARVDPGGGRATDGGVDGKRTGSDDEDA